jgi:hypothetical protein
VKLQRGELPRVYPSVSGINRYIHPLQGKVEHSGKSEFQIRCGVLNFEFTVLRMDCKDRRVESEARGSRLSKANVENGRVADVVCMDAKLDEGKCGLVLGWS